MFEHFDQMCFLVEMFEHFDQKVFGLKCSNISTKKKTFGSFWSKCLKCLNILPKVFFVLVEMFEHFDQKLLFEMF